MGLDYYDESEREERNEEARDSERQREAGEIMPQPRPALLVSGIRTEELMSQMSRGSLSPFSPVWESTSLGFSHVCREKEGVDEEENFAR
jgi:hypothetical protein